MESLKHRAIKVAVTLFEISMNDNCIEELSTGIRYQWDGDRVNFYYKKNNNNFFSYYNFKKHISHPSYTYNNRLIGFITEMAIYLGRIELRPMQIINKAKEANLLDRVMSELTVITQDNVSRFILIGNSTELMSYTLTYEEIRDNIDEKIYKRVKYNLQNYQIK